MTLEMTLASDALGDHLVEAGGTRPMGVSRHVFDLPMTPPLNSNQPQPTLVSFPNAQVALEHPRRLGDQFSIGHYRKRRHVAEDNPLL